VADQLADGQMEIVRSDDRPQETAISIVSCGHSVNNPRIEMFATFVLAALAANTRF
jgi:hypothetical protein